MVVAKSCGAGQCRWCGMNGYGRFAGADVKIGKCKIFTESMPVLEIIMYLCSVDIIVRIIINVSENNKKETYGIK